MLTKDELNLAIAICDKWRAEDMRPAEDSAGNL